MKYEAKREKERERDATLDDYKKGKRREMGAGRGKEGEKNEARKSSIEKSSGIADNTSVKFSRASSSSTKKFSSRRVELTKNPEIPSPDRF